MTNASAAPQDPSAPDDAGTPATVPAPRTIHSDALLGDAAELIIVHGDTCYRLRRTATGKLILTK